MTVNATIKNLLLRALGTLSPLKVNTLQCWLDRKLAGKLDGKVDGSNNYWLALRIMPYHIDLATR